MLFALRHVLAGTCAFALALTALDCKPRRAEQDLVVWLDPQGPVPPSGVGILTSPTPPAAPVVVEEREGTKIVIARVPPDGDATAALEKIMGQAFDSGGYATVVIPSRCLKDLEPGFRKNLLYFWHAAAVIGAPCEGAVPSSIGAAAFVSRGSASRVQITFDRRTRAFVRVQPLR